MSEHTPGPETVDLTKPRKPGEHGISLEYRDAEGRALYRIDLSNFRLIAAAPDLLRALEAEQASRELNDGLIDEIEHYFRLSALGLREGKLSGDFVDRLRAEAISAAQGEAQ